MFSLTSKDRILVIAPHPDDEALGVGGIIQQARRKNIPVSVVFLTHGDGNRVGVAKHFRTMRPRWSQYRAYGKMRQQEAITSLTYLGVSRKNSYFLGLPDQGLLPLLTTKGPEEAYYSTFTQTDRAPYFLSSFPNLPYTQASVMEVLNHLLKKLRPTIILTSLPDDTHSDHRAAALLTLELETTAAKYAYPVHYRSFPKPRGINSSLPLAAPARHPRKDWLVIPLDEEAVAAKLEAVNQYKSQFRVPLLGKLMLSLVRTNELLLPL